MSASSSALLCEIKKYGAVLLCSVFTFAAFAADLEGLKFIQIVEDVKVYSQTTEPHRAASVDELFHSGDVLKTGPSSRAELIGTDNTIIRIGANSTFSVDAADRTIHLTQGSLLFHAPKGKRGWTIYTGSAAATLLGPTVIVSTTPNGGFKVLSMEGRTRIKFNNGERQVLRAGQMTFVLPQSGGSKAGPILDFKLDEQVKGSRLVHGFRSPLPRLTQIERAISRQNRDLLIGRAQALGFLAGDSATETSFEIRLDSNSHASQINPKLKPIHPAFLSDVVVSGGGISPDHLLSRDTGPVPLPSFPGLNDTAIVGGRDIVIRTLIPYFEPLNLTPYSQAEGLLLLAAHDVQITTHLSFVADNPAPFRLFAGNTIDALFHGGGLSYYNTGGLFLEAQNTVDWNNHITLFSLGPVELRSSHGALILQEPFIWGREASLFGSTGIRAENFTVHTANGVNIVSGGPLFLDGGPLFRIYGYISGDYRNLAPYPGFVDPDVPYPPQSIGYPAIFSGSADGDILVRRSHIGGFYQASLVSTHGSIKLEDSDMEADLFLNIHGARGVDFQGCIFYGTGGNIRISSEGPVRALYGELFSDGPIDLLGQTGVDIRGTQAFSAHDIYLNSPDGAVVTSSARFQSRRSNVRIDGRTVETSTQTAIEAAEEVHVSGRDGVTVTDTSVDANGAVFVRSPEGSVSLSSSSVRGMNTIEVQARSDITVNNTSVGFGEGSTRPRSLHVSYNSSNGSIRWDTGSIEATSLNMQAAQLLEVKNVDISSLMNVTLAAHTLVLQDVSFAAGSTVSLFSFLGDLAPNPNSGASPLNGYVNFVNGVLYGGLPAQNFRGNGIMISALGGVP